MYALGLVEPAKKICPSVNSCQVTDTTCKDSHCRRSNLQFTELDSGNWKAVHLQEWELFLQPQLFQEL